MIIAMTDPRTLAAALSAQAHSTVLTRRSPVGKGMPIRKPSGASTMPLMSSLIANGSPMAAESSQGNKATSITMMDEINPSSGRILLPLVNPSPGRYAARSAGEQKQKHNYRERIGGVAQEKHKALDQRNLHQDITEAHGNEVKQSNNPGLGACWRWRCSASGRIRNASTATIEMISNIPSTTTPRLMRQSMPRPVPARIFSITYRVFSVKKKNGALSLTGETL